MKEKACPATTEQASVLSRQSLDLLAASAAIPSATAAAWSLLIGNVDTQRSAVQHLSVHGGLGLLG